MITWIPPKSPYDLLQERFWPDGWKILVVCLLLNQTSRKQVEPMIQDFFDCYPTPRSMIDADEAELFTRIKSLGLASRRVKYLKRFSLEFLQNEWQEVKQLYGCGKYADDTYRIFVMGDWENVQPNDHALNDYHGWLQTWNNTYNKTNPKET